MIIFRQLFEYWGRGLTKTSFMSVEVNRIFPYFNDSHWRLFRKGKNAALIYIFLNKEIYEFETITERIASEQVQNHTKAMEKKQANWFFPLKRKFTKPNSFGSLWLPLCFERSTARCFEFTDLYVSKMQISDRKFVRYKQLGPQSGELNCFWPFNEG